MAVEAIAGIAVFLFGLVGMFFAAVAFIRDYESKAEKIERLNTRANWHEDEAGDT